MPADDIRFILTDRLIRLDARLRAEGKIHRDRNPPEMLVSVSEADALRATAILRQEGLPHGEPAPLDQLFFIGIKLTIIAGPDHRAADV
jgi:type III secretory pathway lipoprotein EscJ